MNKIFRYDNILQILIFLVQYYNIYLKIYFKRLYFGQKNVKRLYWSIILLNFLF